MKIFLIILLLPLVGYSEHETSTRPEVKKIIYAECKKNGKAHVLTLATQDSTAEISFSSNFFQSANEKDCKREKNRLIANGSASEIVCGCRKNVEKRKLKTDHWFIPWGIKQADRAHVWATSQKTFRLDCIDNRSTTNLRVDFDHTGYSSINECNEAKERVNSLGPSNTAEGPNGEIVRPIIPGQKVKLKMDVGWKRESERYVVYKVVHPNGYSCSAHFHNGTDLFDEIEWETNDTTGILREQFDVDDKRAIYEIWLGSRDKKATIKCKISESHYNGDLKLGKKKLIELISYALKRAP